MLSLNSLNPIFDSIIKNYPYIPVSRMTMARRMFCLNWAENSAGVGSIMLSMQNNK